MLTTKQVDHDVIFLLVLGHRNNHLPQLRPEPDPSDPIKWFLRAALAGPGAVDEASIIRTIIDYLFDLTNSCATILAKELYFKPNAEEARRWPLEHIGYISIAATLKNSRKIASAVQKQIGCFVEVRQIEMADEENLFIPGPMKESYTPIAMAVEKAKAKNRKAAKKMENNNAKGTEGIEGTEGENEVKHDVATPTAATAGADAGMDTIAAANANVSFCSRLKLGLNSDTNLLGITDHDR